MEAAWTNLVSREKHWQKLAFPLKLIKTFLALNFFSFSPGCQNGLVFFAQALGIL